jgi:CHASE3 domain sensor protein
MTETKNNNNGLKVIAGLLGVVLLGTIIYTVSLYQDKKTNNRSSYTRERIGC